MRYGFGEYVLDSKLMLLLRGGVEIDIPRRAHLLLNYLIEQRERVVKRDELIRKIWGRDNVSDHQLAQLVRAARQVLGDDGNTQSMIRTVMGVGYHWVGEIVELHAIEPTGTSAITPVLEPVLLPPLSSEPAIPITVPKSRVRLMAIFASAASLVISALVLTRSDTASESLALTPKRSTEQGVFKAGLSGLQMSLAQGQFEQVREGLAKLPEKVIESPQGRMLEIELDIERGRWQQAREKLTREKQRASAAADPIWQAKLALLQAKLLQLSGASREEGLAIAQATVAQLESMPLTVSDELLASGVRRRGALWMATGQLDNAALDFAQARDLYLRAGDQRSATQASCGLARVWMRQGRLVQALEQVTLNASTYAQLNDPISELLARNTALRIQVELLRWPDALENSDRAMQLLQIAPDAERRYRTLQLRAMVLASLGRLREAESTLEEARAQSPFQNEEEIAESQIIPTLQHLASKRFDQALASADAAFSPLPADPHNILFDGRDGALLLWVMAAQKLAGRGEALPTPSPEQIAVLRQPETTLTRVAQGRWLSLRGEAKEAEQVLRQALNESRQQNHLYRMLLAGEPLMELLKRSGDTAGADRVLAELRVQDPARIDQVRQMQASEDQFSQVAQFDTGY